MATRTTHDEPEIVTTPLKAMRAVRSEVRRRSEGVWPEQGMRLQETLWPHPKHALMDDIDGVSPTTLSKGRSEARYCLPYRYKTALAAEVARRSNLEPVDLAIADLIAFRAELQSVVEEPSDLTAVQDKAFARFNEAVEHIYEATKDGRLDSTEKRALVGCIEELMAAARSYRSRLMHDLESTDTLALEA